MNALTRFWRTTMNPDMYHGHGRKPPFFEGWYYKLLSADGRHRYAIIPGIFKGEGGHAFIQVLHGMSGHSTYHRFDLNDFWASETAFEVRIGDNHFGPEAISLAINRPEGQVQGGLRFEGLSPWPVTLTAPGIMGWYAWVPRMETYHGVVSLDHTIRGGLAIDGQDVDLEGGRGYIEKDWGQSFPSAYVWMQSNHFDTEGTCLTASIAMIPWVGQAFRGFIVGFWHQKRLVRLATYTGARTDELVIEDDHVHWVVSSRRYRLEMTATRPGGGLLHEPTRQDMIQRVEETMKSQVQVRLTAADGSEVFDQTGRYAALEVHGDLPTLLSTKGSWLPFTG